MHLQVLANGSDGTCRRSPWRRRVQHKMTILHPDNWHQCSRHRRSSSDDDVLWSPPQPFDCACARAYTSVLCAGVRASASPCWTLPVKWSTPSSGRRARMDSPAPARSNNNNSPWWAWGIHKWADKGPKCSRDQDNSSSNKDLVSLGSSSKVLDRHPEADLDSWDQDLQVPVLQVVLEWVLVVLEWDLSDLADLVGLGHVETDHREALRVLVQTHEWCKGLVAVHLEVLQEWAQGVPWALPVAGSTHPTDLPAKVSQLVIEFHCPFSSLVQQSAAVAGITLRVVKGKKRGAHHQRPGNGPDR